MKIEKKLRGNSLRHWLISLVIGEKKLRHWLSEKRNSVTGYRRKETPCSVKKCLGLWAHWRMGYEPETPRVNKKAAPRHNRADSLRPRMRWKVTT